MDPDYYTQVDIHNPHRLIRALEVCTVAGMPYSSLRKASGIQRNFTVEKIGLEMPREQLYDRINARVLRMMEEGLLEEARALYPFKQLQALNTVRLRKPFRKFSNTRAISRNDNSPGGEEMLKSPGIRYSSRAGLSPFTYHLIPIP
jgi:tRNA dimethylallyltransferase